MRIGVTGIFASGKGTVCAMFEELGAEVIDTDIIAREIVLPGGEAIQEILKTFGDQFVSYDGNLKRRELADFVFKFPERVAALNAITHPLILKISIARSEGNKIFMINTPLLFEAKFNFRMDKNIVVFSEVNQAVERGMKRDKISENEILERLNHQIPLNDKIKSADYVIDNSGSFDNTKRQVFELWKVLTQNPIT